MYHHHIRKRRNNSSLYNDYYSAYFNSWFNTLNDFHTNLSNLIIKYPSGFILWPAIITFILSFPSLYYYYSSSTNHVSNNVKSVSIEKYDLPVLNPTFELKQLWIQSTLNSNDYYTNSADDYLNYKTLNKDFLLEILDLQNELLTGIDLYNETDSHSLQNKAVLHSPLEYWSNDRTSLLEDKNVLKTIHTKVSKRSSVGMPLSHFGLFTGIVKTDGLLTSAKALQITLIFTPDKSICDAGCLWDQNLASIKSHNGSSFVLFEHNPINEELEKDITNFDSYWALKVKHVHIIEKIILNTILIGPFIYIIISLSNIHSVKSRSGLLLAYLVEITLSGCSSLTISSFFFDSQISFQNPFRILFAPLIFITLENMFRLVMLMSKTSSELPTSSRIHQAVSKSSPTSTTLVVLNTVLITLLYFLYAGNEGKQFCFFAIFVLITDHFLHITYFTAVLSVDIRRSELEDLLQLSTSSNLINPLSGTSSTTPVGLNNGIKLDLPTTIKPLSGGGAILSSSLLNEFSTYNESNVNSSYKRMLGQFLLTIKLPFFHKLKTSIAMSFLLLIFSLKWADCINYENTTGLSYPILQSPSNPTDCKYSMRSTSRVNNQTNWEISTTDYPLDSIYFDQKSFAVELSSLAKRLKLSNSLNKSKRTGKRVPYEEIIIHFNVPVVIIPKKSVELNSQYQRMLTFKPLTIYKFDYLYYFEFFSCLLFVFSSSALILKFSVDKDDLRLFNEDDTTDKKSPGDDLIHSSNLHSKDLIKGHFLDVVKVCTSTCPFIVSVGMDHKVLVWSPLSTPLPPPAQLPISGRLLPITNVAMSSSGSLIAIFSKSGVVKCWSRFTMSWLFTVQIDVLKDNKPLESFFRKRTTAIPARRRIGGTSGGSKKKLVQRGSKSNSTTSSENGDTTSETGSTGKRRSLKSRKNVDTSEVIDSEMVSGLFDNDSVQNLKMTQFQLMKDFVIVLPTGELIEINCANGNVTRSTLTNLPIVSVNKISSPRVNDRIVCTIEDGSMVVATVVNNKWKPRSIKIQKESYNSGQSLLTPAAISRASSMNLKSIQQFQKFRANSKFATNFDIHQGSDAIELNSMSASGASAAAASTTASSVNYSGCVVELVPFVGMIVRAKDVKAELIDVQSGILLKEFTIGQFKDDSFHVFHPEPSHCRFCGCASISSFSIAYTELDSNTLILHTFSIDNRAKNSICLRVERDPRETRCLGFASVSEHQHWLSNVEGWCPTDLNMIMGVRRKENEEFIDGKVNFKGAWFDDSDDGDDYFYNRNNITRQSNSSSILRDLTQSKNRKNMSFNNRSNGIGRNPELSDIWESFTLSATGEVKYYNIPDGLDSGLLIKRPGPVKKFGHKSIVVSFGNIMKILYLGNDKLIDEGNENDFDSTSEGQSLSFINRRRKMRLKKYELTHSTNFNDTPPDDQDDDGHISEEN